VLTQSQIRSYWSPRCTGPFALVALYGAGRVYVRTPIVEAVKALNTVLKSYGYVTRAADTGAYNCRMNTSGTAWSIHAYAIALDINWQSNPYSSTLRTDMLRYGDGRMPHKICAIRTNNGKQVWNWGGFWSGNKDAMHYEIVCTPADIRTGINWTTVKGYVAPAPEPVQEDDEMQHIIRGNADTRWYVTDGIWKRYISSKDDAAVLAYTGIAKWNNGGPFVWPQASVDALKTAS
jgi:hypothetical protein